MGDGARADGDLDRAKRLEVGLIGLRWFVVSVGVLVTAASMRTDPARPDYLLPLGFLLVAGLALGNVAISALTERASRMPQMGRIGLAAFAMDLGVITGLVWTYTTPGNSLWVLAYVLPLEGAVRYRLRGALIPVVLTLVAEPVRELSVTLRFPAHAYLASAVIFRVGVELAVALVAGLMSRSLRREADHARERAALAEEAARREAAARRELSAFHTAVLAGVAADDVRGAIRSMTATIARDLELDALGILLLEDDRLAAEGVHGLPGYPSGAHLTLGEGVAGRAALEGVPAQGGARADGTAEAAVPLRVGTDLLGVLHVATRAGRIEDDTLATLAALGDQIAMVIHAALLRDRQDETLRRLRELDEMKSDFVAITSHELRTPLAAVRGFVNTLQRKMDVLTPEEVQEFLAIVERQTDRLIRLVEDLLVVSRIEAGTLALEPQAVHPSELLDHVVTGFGDRAERIRYVVGPDLPELFVADPGRLGQVLTNLLENALKFSPPDTAVGLSLLRDGEHLVFRVRDEGIGIPPHEVDRIFERFHQTDAAVTRAAEGAGLGLYITRKLVEAMGGRIDVASELGAGSTFTVRLPLGPVEGRARPSVTAQAD
ncbi:MAG: sensor histidine kinase [Candidatus Velamenicoccus archaeovorus]